MIAKYIVNYSAPMGTWIVLLPALLGIYDRPTTTDQWINNGPTNLPTVGQKWLWGTLSMI